MEDLNQYHENCGGLIDQYQDEGDIGYRCRTCGLEGEGPVLEARKGSMAISGDEIRSAEKKFFDQLVAAGFSLRSIKHYETIVHAGCKDSYRVPEMRNVGYSETESQWQCVCGARGQVKPVKYSNGAYVSKGQLKVEFV